MNQTINIGFAKLNELKYFLLLSHNEKQELFLRLLWGQTRPTYFYDGLDKSEHDIKNIDHISFHKDGKIHLISYDSSNKRDVIYHKKLARPISRLLSNEYIPLVVFSVYDLEKAKKFVGQSIPLTYKNSGNVQKQKNVQAHWEIGNENRFSLAIFLIGWHSVDTRVDVKSMFESQFPSIFSMGATFFIEDYLVNGQSQLGLAIAYTKKVIPQPSKQGVIGPEKSKELTRIEPLYGFDLVAADDTIRRLV